MSHVFPRQSSYSLPTVFKGDGVYLIDKTGKRYIDGSCGPATSCLGHTDPEVIKAIKEQLDQVAYAHTGFFTSEPAERLADALIDKAPPGIDRVYFVSGGSEAIEASLKLARQYFVEIKQSGRHHVIARRQSYHGNTLGALATGGNKQRREAFGPLLRETSLISPCYEYRDRTEGESVIEYGLRVANELQVEIERLGPENVMAFVAETVVGATAGALPPVDGYFKRIRQICDNYGVLLILDEVMCGMGRCGTLFAFEQDDVKPDIITIAKGLGAGYQPIGAMLCTDKIYQTIVDGSGFFQHGHTYMGHPTACAGSLAVLKRLTEDGLVSQSKALGGKMLDSLLTALGEHPNVGDIRGRGLFLGLEIVKNRESKEPFLPEQGIHRKIKKAAFECGLICYPSGGTIDGTLGDHVLLAPPFIMNDGHIEEITEKLTKAMDMVL